MHTSPGFAKFSGIAGAFDKAGKRAPGQRLRVEHLKDQYQLSSGTLREALSLLVPDALVPVKRQRGGAAPRMAWTACMPKTPDKEKFMSLTQALPAGPLAWPGRHRNVFCVDFSAGGRWTERKAGSVVGQHFKLAALRCRCCWAKQREIDDWSNLM